MADRAVVVEQREADRRMRMLAATLVEQKAIRSAAWRAVFERVPRHPFLPAFYLADSSDDDRVVWRWVQADATPEWLDLVYQNETYVTRLEPATMQAVDGGWRGRPTSSCPKPSLIARMLEALRVRDGHRVLEIGTGSGYQAALLSEWLGGQHVSSVDIDPTLAGTARQRLGACGYTPTVAAADGAEGYPPNAPFDRIIATCAVTWFPSAWLIQTRPGGIIVANLRGEFGGALVRLTVADSGTANGRFLPHWGGFMALRHDPERYPQSTPPGLDTGAAVERQTDFHPAALLDDLAFGFVAQLYLPGVRWSRSWPDETGDWSLRLWAADGSWAFLPHMLSPARRWTVLERGPRGLWALVERAWQWWQAAGDPRWDRFGISITPDGQRIWYGEPGSGQHWPLLPK